MYLPASTDTTTSKQVNRTGTRFHPEVEFSNVEPANALHDLCDKLYKYIYTYYIYHLSIELGYVSIFLCNEIRVLIESFV